MNSSYLEDTLQELFGEASYSVSEVVARLNRLRLGIACEELLEECFVSDREGCRLRVTPENRLVRETRPALTEEQRERLKDWFCSRLRETRQAMDVSVLLDTLPAEARERIPFDWLEVGNPSLPVHQVSRILRHDARFLRYEGHSFGLSEWEDPIHLNYWWKALEAARHPWDPRRFEACAGKVEALSLPEGLATKLRCIVTNYRQDLSRQVTQCPSKGPP